MSLQTAHHTVLEGEAYMSRVFISYRRADSAGVTGRIFGRLVGTLGREAVFKNVDDIPPGVNFATYVEKTLRQCAVLLLINVRPPDPPHAPPGSP